jgi:predicted component of type VI protein secretion system
MTNWKMAMAATALTLALSACSSMPEHQSTIDARNGPTFTQEEKDAMSTEEKVALYNAEVREQDQLVCRRERIVGSRLTKTRCLSQAEWQALHENSQEALRRAQYDTHIRGGGN